MPPSLVTLEGAALSSKNYLLATAWIGCGLLIGVALFNYFVDPYYRYGTNRIGVYLSSEREFKSTGVQKYPHELLIVGNSKPAMMDPLVIEAVPAFNGSFAGAMPEEIYYFLNQYAHDQKLVVMAVDIGMFNEKAAPIKPNPFERKWLPDTGAYLLNLKALQYSTEAIFSWLTNHELTIFPSGQSNAYSHFKKDAPLVEPYYGPVLDMLKNTAFRDFTYSTKRVEYLRRIRDLLEARGIPLIVFINPENAAVLDMIHSLPSGESWDRWKADVRSVFPDVIDLSAEEAWQSPTHYFKHDPYHYVPVAAQKILTEELLPHILEKTGAKPHPPRDRSDRAHLR